MSRVSKKCAAREMIEEDDRRDDVKPTPIATRPPVAPRRQRAPSNRAVTPEPQDDLIIIESPHSAFDRVLAARRSPQSITPTKRKAASARIDLSIDSDLDPSSVPLPDHLTALLNLYSALEKALILHLGVEGAKAACAVSAQPRTDDDTISYRLENLITFSALRPLVEHSASKTFTASSFAQLVSIWQAGDEDAMGYLITKTKERCRKTGRTLSVWALGLQLVVKQNVPVTSRSLVNTPSKNATTPTKTPKARDGMNLIALWSQASEPRKAEVRERLGRLVIRAHEEWQARSMPTPRSIKRKIKTETTLDPRFDLGSVPKVPLADLPDLSSPVDSPVMLAESPIRKMATAPKAGSLLDRIKAKEAAKTASLPTKANEMAQLQRKSALSRLPDVAELFSPLAPPSPKSGTVSAFRRRSAPLDDVLAQIVKSSRVALSSAEAREALTMLIELCPTFVTLHDVAARQYVHAGPGLALNPVKQTLAQELAKA